ncbi:cation transporter [Marinicella pacifica]|uniref:Cation transporter n=1 Tax=Marinicella pacifica TaxID=1171543 RepID=A0A917CKG2_9GAMM|nr:cation diffusion facilitator family transporter [Marinicella pacifica]GGF89252.1 cation transporter [Marinicella pacifica]
MSDSHHHDHNISVNQDNKKRVFIAMLMTFGFMLAEVIGGIISGSLALLADAGHMLSDGVSLLLSWVAFIYSDKQADFKRTFGWHRFQTLAAFVNGLTLLAIAVWIIWEAGWRFYQPVEVMAKPMFIIAVLGLLVNVIVFKILQGGDHDNLNLKSAMIHVMGDLLGSVAAILAAVLIYLFAWNWADPLLSLLVALLIMRSGWFVVKKATHILLEGSPDVIDIEAVKNKIIADIKTVTDVHHVHTWSLTNDKHLMSLHIKVNEHVDDYDVLWETKELIQHNFPIFHTTIQIEHLDCPDDSC